MKAVNISKVLSNDGTPIAFYSSGRGSPLILVAGSGAANPVAWPAVPALEEHYRLLAVDRRGRGESGDGATYTIEREFEDLAAVIDTTGGPADLLGHSFGALLALEAALLSQNLRRLILYEPLIPRPGTRIYPEGYIDRLEAQLGAGDRESALITHYRENAGLTEDEIEAVKSSPIWPARLATVHTLPREMRAEEGYEFDAPRFRDFHTPTLLLLGGESPAVFQESAETVKNGLPNCRIAMIAGEKHIAMYTAPELFAAEVVQFLDENDRR
jgi:pimeloyl-ACP methyl ester carboxylesterase